MEMNETPNGGKPWTMKQIVAHLEKITPEWHGNLAVYEQAVGGLFCGHFHGYQCLRICHAWRTLKKWESALDVTFRDVLPDRTEHSRKVRGVRMADNFDKFWQAVNSGQIKHEESQIIDAVAG